MTFLIVSGTGTEVGKTVVTAAVVANALKAEQRVAVVKPAQTGVSEAESGDLQEVQRLTGIAHVVEYARYPDPLAPAAAARMSGQVALDLKSCVADLQALADTHDLVVIEGAGGLLVRFDDAPTSLADLAVWLAAPVLLVVHASLGTLNHTELTLHRLSALGIPCAGIVIGSWPTEPDLAMRSNLRDLEVISGRPLRGAVPAGSAAKEQDGFAAIASASLDSGLGGTFDAADFRRRHDPSPTDPAR
jgi:dethiobiotin synthetase